MTILFLFVHPFGHLFSPVKYNMRLGLENVDDLTLEDVPEHYISAFDDVFGMQAKYIFILTFAYYYFGRTLSNCLNQERRNMKNNICLVSLLLFLVWFEHKICFDDVDKVIQSHGLPTLSDPQTRKYANIWCHIKYGQGFLQLIYDTIAHLTLDLQDQLAT